MIEDVRRRFDEAAQQQEVQLRESDFLPAAREPALTDVQHEIVDRKTQRTPDLYGLHGTRPVGYLAYRNFQEIFSVSALVLPPAAHTVRRPCLTQLISTENDERNNKETPWTTSDNRNRRSF